MACWRCGSIMAAVLRNGISTQTVSTRNWGEAFSAVARDGDNRAIILTATGESFLTEIDSGSGTPEVMDARFWHRIYREGMALLTNLLAIEVPMIAAVNGDAFIHAELPVLCDIVLAREGAQRWPGKTAQGDKWIFCKTAAIVPHDRRSDEQTTTPEPQSGFQSEGGIGCREGREDAGRVGAAL
jgi:Enoyl-CoA hydratase/isomerase